MRDVHRGLRSNQGNALFSLQTVRKQDVLKYKLLKSDMFHVCIHPLREAALSQK